MAAVMAAVMSAADSEVSKASSRGLLRIPMRMSTIVSVPGGLTRYRRVH
jgi:hypothetical protein